MARKTCGLSFALAMAIGATSAAHAAQFDTHHVRDVVSQATAKQVGNLPATKLMAIDVVLPVRDQAGLDQFVANVTNPLSLQYRQYVTPQEFTARFGPTQNDYDTVVQYLTKYGFTITGGSRDGLDVQAVGPVSAVEAAFNVKMHTYQHPTENRVFYSPDREPTTSLAISLWHVSGLDNYSIPHPMYVKKSDYAAAHGVSPEAVVSHATTGSGPSASFLGSDMRAAYVNGTTLTGSGQTLGLFEYEGINTSDVQLYYTGAKQTNPNNLTVISTDGTATNCSGSCTDIEQTIDTTQAQGMAPGLSHVLMFVGSTDTAIISDMTTYSPLPITIGCSWGWTPADPTTLNPYWEKMAAQGQSFFAASGDSSTWSSRNEAWPADAAYVISTGGTDLVTSSAAGPWKSETAWEDSGGGISPDKIAIPTWQSEYYKELSDNGSGASDKYRNGPDVSANANFSFYACGNGSCTANEYGGTSFATPMWAAFIALVNQSLASNDASPMGFFDPTIYANNATNSTIYADTFHDITSGKSGSYSAEKGYDLVTGWGSPLGSGFIAQYGK
ncbi:S53 family peptidase [Dyella caseinilytica]|uniref:S8/S53 family peptidase n=1 Tax=Dyella caseinilytica TaxID=1849581 RepID=A0ABX7GUH4_9GAMM|nr:S53 family peptidase [Dyella caseinilytica]QRN53613.1 S8/S53 family peptidase [Dyella caseinilytica]GFZ87897.1 pseudomonapepsin [Dyella caseinilytica]